MADRSGVAKSGWMLFGIGLLAVSPFVPAHEIGLLLPGMIALGFMARTHMLNPDLSIAVYPYQVLIFNIPIVGWWLALRSIVPDGRWELPAMAAASVCYSFSVGAVGLYLWLMRRSTLARRALLAAAAGLLAISVVMILMASKAQDGALIAFAAVATTFALLLQRLLALPFDDELLGTRNKLMAVTGVALFIAYQFKLAPAIFAPALVYGGGWLLAGALFTLVMSAISEMRAPS